MFVFNLLFLAGQWLDDPKPSPSGVDPQCMQRNPHGKKLLKSFFTSIRLPLPQDTIEESKTSLISGI